MRKCFLFIYSLVFGLWSGVLLADPLIVTASVILDEEANELKDVEIISTQELKEKNVRTLPESFAETPGVSVQKTTHGHGSPYIRGFTGRQNVLLIDGVRVNNSTWRSGPIQYWNTVDSSYLDEISLVRGVGSVLYGSDALGGVVNLKTRSIGTDLETGPYRHGEFQYRIDSNTVSHVTRLATQLGAGGENGWGVHLGGSFKEFGDLKDSALDFENTGYPEQNIEFKAEKFFKNSTLLTVAHQYTNQDDIWRWHSTELNDRPWVKSGSITATGSDFWRIYDQERSLSYVKLEGVSSSSLVDEWSGILSYQKSQDSEDRYRFTSGEFRRDLRILDVETYGASLKAKKILNAGSLLYGVDHYYDSVSSEGRRLLYASRFGSLISDNSRSANRPVADGSSYWTTGLYIQPTLHVTDQLTFQGGLRYSDIRAQWDLDANDQAGKNDWQDLSSHLKFAYDFANEWRVGASYSEGFRAPNLDDLTGRQFALSGLLSSGSPDLNPEEFQSFEINVNFETARSHLQLNLFYSRLRDMIVRVSNGSNLFSVNAGKGRTYGFEFDWRYELTDQWKVGTYASSVIGRTEQPTTLGGAAETSYFSKLPPLSGGVYTRYNGLKRPWWAELIIKGAEKADRLSTNELNGADAQRVPINGTPAYVIATLRGGYQVTEKLALNLTLENLTDEDYRVHGSGVNGGGFSSILGLDYRW